MPEMHLMLDHQHEEVKHCDSDVPHIHDTDYAPVQCFICAMLISPSESDIAALKYLDVETVISQPVFYYETFSDQLLFLHYFLRGPPPSRA